MSERQCAQCWRPKPLDEFIGARGGLVRRCAECREKYANWTPGNRASTPRRSLPVVHAAGETRPRVVFTLRSQNRKLGKIPKATVTAETCPPSCGFYGKGCYAEFGPQGHHWRQAVLTGQPWDQFLRDVRALPPAQLWRYADAGDLPGLGDKLDVAALGELIHANLGRRGFTFTHKPLTTSSELAAVAAANYYGFTVNLSADSLKHADARASLDVGPVVVVVPKDGAIPARTPRGRHLVACLHETRGLTCDQCQLCSIAKRGSIVAFRAHGQMAATVGRIAGGVA